MKNIKFALTLVAVVQSIAAATVARESKKCSVYDIDFRNGEKSQLIMADDLTVLDDGMMGGGGITVGTRKYNGVELREKLVIKTGDSRRDVYGSLKGAFGRGIVDITDEIVDCDELEVMREHYRDKKAADL
jgi:hypothetical protein